MAQTLLNEHCCAVLLKKLPENLGDPCKFLIPSDYPGMAECLALADLSVSINLMLFSVWKILSLLDLTPTCMNLELAACSISRPVEVAEDVYVKVGSFYFPADFVVVDFDADPRVPLILERSFLKTRRALIDVFEGELTLRVGKEAITFNLDQTSRYSANYNDMTKKIINVIDMACEEYSQEDLGFLIQSQVAIPFRTMIRLFQNDDPSLPLPNQRNSLPEVRKELKICKANSKKSLVDEPPVVELKDLPSYLEYAFLEGDDKLPVIIVKDLSVEEKTALITVLKSHKQAIAMKLSDIKEVIKLLEAGLIYPISDSPWVSPVHCVLKNGGFTVVENEDNELIPTHLEKGHFMVKEGMVLGHKISKQGIEVDKAKVDVITKLPHPTTVKELNYTTTEKEMLAVVYAFEKFQSYLILNKSIMYTDHSALKYLFAKKDSKARLLRWVLLLQEFTFKVIDTKGAENLAADHLSRLEKPHQNVLDPKEINESFIFETLNLVSTHGENRASWSDKLDDALLAFRIAYKTPIGCTPYKLVYRKACHHPVKLEHKAYWALKHVDFELKTAEKTKRLHDSKIKNRVFNIGDRVYPYGTIELSQPDGPDFKLNGHRLKHYFGEDVPKLVKENKEKDKIRSKPDKNGKRVKAQNSQKQFQSR
nr:reverse transcriptase domain-containing protein [Tanacetum cinerariifolium]